MKLAVLVVRGDKGMDKMKSEVRIKRDGRIWICCPDCHAEQTYVVYGQIFDHEIFKCKNCGTAFMVNDCLNCKDA